MKTKLMRIFSALLILSTVFISCSTTKVEQKDPNFLADMDAIYLGDAVCLNKQNFFKPKAITVDVEFLPRNSNIRLSLKDGMNKVVLVFTNEEFRNFAESVGTYTEMYENNQLDRKNYKPNRKNNFNKGKVDIYWGAVGLGRNVTAPYDTNYQLVEVEGETNPYFRLEVHPTDYPEEENVASPNVTLYFTPSQLKQLILLINMDTIMQDINDFNNAAYSFE